MNFRYSFWLVIAFESIGYDLQIIHQNKIFIFYFGILNIILQVVLVLHIVL